MSTSPTPWRWRDAYDFREHLEHRKDGLEADCENIEAGRIQLVDATGAVVLEEWAQHAADGGLTVTQPDAALIARAVNAHWALVAALVAAEWTGPNGGCPTCGGAEFDHGGRFATTAGHAKGCTLAAALALATHGGA